MFVQSAASHAKAVRIIYLVVIINSSELIIMVQNTFVIRLLEIIKKTCSLATRIKFLSKTFFNNIYKIPNDLACELADYDIYSTSNRKIPRYLNFYFKYDFIFTCFLLSLILMHSIFIQM